MYVDKTLVCKDCGEKFTFTAQEQEFYAQKGFQNDPARCYSCRQAKKRNSQSGNYSVTNRPPREKYSAICSECGKEALVPFKPTLSKPVYCSECYQKLSGKRNALQVK